MEEFAAMGRINSMIDRRHYLKEFFIHRHSDVPILTYLELNEDRMVLRKVEIMPNGEIQQASVIADDEGIPFNRGTSIENCIPIPSIDEINEHNPDMLAAHETIRAFKIEKTEFDIIWRQANQRFLKEYASSSEEPSRI